MLAILVSSMLACPPTTVSKASKGDHDGHLLAGPHVGRLAAQPALPTSEPPELPHLPLWNLETARAELGRVGDFAWLGWAAAPERRSSHAQLVDALSSSSLSAERMLWWLARSPPSPDARVALIDAYDQAELVQTKLLLAIALALAHFEASCPVEVGPDGACRMPGTSIAVEDDVLVRRDSIALERANDWRRKATALAKRVKIDPSELAMQALLAELELVAAIDDYESMLVARLPPELSFEIEDYRQDSGVPEWERIHARQIESNGESRRRLRAFQVTQTNCMHAQFDVYERVEQASASAAMQASLRRAKLMFAFVETLDNDEGMRTFVYRNAFELGPEFRWSGGIDSSAEASTEQALEQAEQCVEIGTTLGGGAELLEACFTLLEAHDPYYVPLAELVPEPGATTTMHSSGLIPL